MLFGLRVGLFGVCCLEFVVGCLRGWVVFRWLNMVLLSCGCVLCDLVFGLGDICLLPVGGLLGFVGLIGSWVYLFWFS